MKQAEFTELFQKFLHEEKMKELDIEILMNSLQEERHHQDWNEVIYEVLVSKAFVTGFPQERKEEIFQKIISIPRNKVVEMYPKNKTYLRLNWVAVIALLTGICIWYYLTHFRPRTDPRTELVKTELPRFKNDIPAGSDKAILVMADGKKVLLNEIGNHSLKEKNGVVINNNAGTIGYKATNQSGTEVLYNTIQIPRKGQYQLVLSDGSRVWLNSESSLRFPTAFLGKERTVQITGEAYFEVAKDPSRPFKVKNPDGAEVTVLGTHFNINSYPDESGEQTTLLEGSVKITKGNTTKFLKPGQQAEITKEGTIAVLNKIDPDQTIAWKNGKFYFKSADIGQVMRLLSRWYDLDVEYKGNMNQKFNAKIPKNMSLVNVFKILEESGLAKFSIDGKKITVTP